MDESRRRRDCKIGVGGIIARGVRVGVEGRLGGGEREPGAVVGCVVTKSKKQAHALCGGLTKMRSLRRNWLLLTVGVDFTYL